MSLPCPYSFTFYVFFRLFSDVKRKGHNLSYNVATFAYLLLKDSGPAPRTFTFTMGEYKLRRYFGLSVILVIYLHIFGSLEVKIQALVAHLKAIQTKGEDMQAQRAVIENEMKDLVKTYIQEKLSNCSNITYKDSLASALVKMEEFSDLIP
jgi:hypothetical protein